MTESAGLPSAIRAERARKLPLGDTLARSAQSPSATMPDMLLREVAATIRRLMGSPYVYVRLRNTDTDELEAMAFSGVPEPLCSLLLSTALPPSFYQRLLQPRWRIDDSLIYCIDMAQEVYSEPFLQPDHPHYTPQLAEMVSNKTLIAPLRSQGERLLGSIYVAAPDNLDEIAHMSIQVLEALTHQSSLALENMRLAQRSERLLSKEQLIASLGRDVSASLDLDTILRRTIGRIADRFADGSVELLDPEGNVELVAAVGSPTLKRYNPSKELTKGIQHQVVTHRLPFFTNDILVEMEQDEVDVESDIVLALQTAPERVRSYVAVPLRSGGQVIGTVNVSDPRPSLFSYEDVDLLEAIAAQIAGPITSAQLYHESQRLMVQLQERADQLSALNSVARIVTSTLDLESILEDVTLRLQQSFGFRQVIFYLLDDRSNQLAPVAHAGAGEDDEDTDIVSEERAALGIPLTLSGRMIGALEVSTDASVGFSIDDVAVLGTAADILAGAMENVRLYRRSQVAAVIEERNRLARELHDSVTQQLFGMTLTAQALRTHMEKNPQRAAAQVAMLSETATSALGEMRTLIAQLRPPTLEEEGLVASLQQPADGGGTEFRSPVLNELGLFAAVRQHAGLIGQRWNLRIETNTIGDESLAFRREQAVYRIVQEALSNIIKHAQASKVQIDLDFNHVRLFARIKDDGRGFSPSQPTTGRHYGLSTMRERATGIGGTLEIRSAPQQGTEIVLTVPRTS